MTKNPAGRAGFIIGFFLLLAQPAQAERVGLRPHLVIDEPVFEVEFKPGVAFEHYFTLRNEGKLPLLIENVLTGCGCAAVAYDESIPPGGRGGVRFTVYVYPEWSGRELRRAIWLMTNDPEAGQVSLVVRGRVAEAEAVQRQ